MTAAEISQKIDDIADRLNTVVVDPYGDAVLAGEDAVGALRALSAEVLGCGVESN